MTTPNPMQQIRELAEECRKPYPQGEHGGRYADGYNDAQNDVADCILAILSNPNIAATLDQPQPEVGEVSDEDVQMAIIAAEAYSNATRIGWETMRAALESFAARHVRGVPDGPTHAEIASMSEELAESDDLRERMADILTRTANALKGKPADLSLHSWHDLPEVATEIARDREDAARYRCLRELDGGAIYAIVGDCDGIHPEQLDKAIDAAMQEGSRD